MVRRTRFAAGVALAVGLLSSTAGRAAEPNWSSIMTGIDGIVLYCEATVREPFVTDYCDRAAKTFKAEFEGRAPRFVANGVVFTGEAARAGETAATDPFKTADGVTTPLVIRLLLKGISSKEQVITGGFTVFIPHTAAIEAGSPGAGKAGDLVVHDNIRLATGPRARLIAFLADVFTKDAKALADAIRAGGPK